MMQRARKNFASLRSTKEDFHGLRSHQDGLFLREPEHIPRRQLFLRAHRKDNPIFSCKRATAALGCLKTLNKNNENRKKPINAVSYRQRDLKSGEPANEHLEVGEREVLTEGDHDVHLSARNTSGTTYNEPKSTQLTCVLWEKKVEEPIEVDSANNQPAVQFQGKTSSNPVDDCTILNMDSLPDEEGDEVVYHIFYQDEPFETYKSVMEAGGVNDRFINNPSVQPRGDTFSSGLFPYMQKDGTRQEMIVVGQKMQDFISKLDLMDLQSCEPENITEDLPLETAELWNKKHYSDSSAINNKKNVSGLPSESYTKDKGLAPQDMLLHEEPCIDEALTNIENLELPNWTNSDACKQGSVEPSHTVDGPSHESLLDLLSEKIQTLDTPKQEYILHILEKLEMGELINSSCNCSTSLKQENELYVPEENIICREETKGQVVVLCLLSSWEDATLVGLTEVLLVDITSIKSVIRFSLSAGVKDNKLNCHCDSNRSDTEFGMIVIIKRTSGI